MIKIAAAVIVTVLCLTAASPADEMAAAVDKCKKPQGISDLRSIMNEGSMTLKDESNEAGRCFIECLMTEFGILKGDKLDIDTVMEQAKDMIEYAKAHQKKVDENMLKSSFQDCGSKDGDGKCMRTYKIWTCLNDIAQKTTGFSP